MVVAKAGVHCFPCGLFEPRDPHQEKPGWMAGMVGGDAVALTVPMFPGTGASVLADLGSDLLPSD